MVETLEREPETMREQISPAETSQFQKRPEIILLWGPMGALVKAEAGREARIAASNKRITEERAPIDLGVSN